MTQTVCWGPRDGTLSRTGGGGKPLAGSCKVISTGLDVEDSRYLQPKRGVGREAWEGVILAGPKIWVSSLTTRQVCDLGGNPADAPTLWRTKGSAYLSTC